MKTTKLKENKKKSVEMVDITDTVLSYRNCIRDLWNSNFRKQALVENIQDETREYYDHIRGTLFNALICLKEFGEALQPVQEVFYNEIQVQPGIGPLGYRCLYSRIEKNEDIWDYISIKTENNSFKFVDFFDWSDEDVMDCQYTEVILVGSNEFPELIGSSFLFDAATVRYWALTS
jgi:hypothetical protein